MPPRRIVLTFDDAYRVTMLNTHELLRARDIPYTVFVPTDHVGRDNMWNPKARYLTAHMSWQELRRLTAQGVEIGSHCCSHHSLTKFGSMRTRKELSASKATLEKRLASRISIVAYPYGDVTAPVAALAGEFYELGFSVSQGEWDWGSAPFAINRIPVTRGLSPQGLLARIEAVESLLAVRPDVPSA